MPSALTDAINTYRTTPSSKAGHDLITAAEAVNASCVELQRQNSQLLTQMAATRRCPACASGSAAAPLSVPPPPPSEAPKSVRMALKTVLLHAESALQALNGGNIKRARKLLHAINSAVDDASRVRR